MQNTDNEEIISWDQDGERILIKDVQKLEAVIIPANFSLKKMASFIRQLHLYDFHKNKDRAHDYFMVFSNPLFKEWDRYPRFYADSSPPASPASARQKNSNRATRSRACSPCRPRSASTMSHRSPCSDKLIPRS